MILSRYCIAGWLTLAIVAAPVSGDDAVTRTYTGTACAFSFEYPAGWTATENPAAGVKDPHGYEVVARCAVGLRPPGWSAEMRRSPVVLLPYPVRVVFWNKGFARSARDSFFVRVGDLAPEQRPSMIRDLEPWDWAILVRHGIDPARQFRTGCCQGVRGTSWGHAQAKDGSKATIVWEGAVINDRNGHSLVIESDHDERFKPVVTQILESSRFGRQRP